MSERQLVASVLAVTIAAAVGLAVPGWVVIGVVAIAVWDRRTSAVVLALVVVVSWNAARAEAGLNRAPGPVAGTATLVGDPEVRFDAAVVDVAIDGSRLRATVPRSVAPDLADAAVGERVDLVGRVAELGGPWAWRASRHLAGELRVARAGPIRPGAWWWRAANGFRRWIGDGASVLDVQPRALFTGIVIGDDRAQHDVMRHRFRASGLGHLMAVSGQNVAFALLAVSPLLGRVRLRWRWIGSVVVLGGFVLVTRAEPSVLRAAAMAAVAVSATWAGRWSSGLRTLGVSVLILLMVDPLLVWSVGFRLSIIATAALVVASGQAAERVPGPRWLAEMVGASIAASVATSLLVVDLSGSVPVLGVAANVVAVPVAGWLMVWGLVAAPVAGLVGGVPAELLMAPARLGVWWLDGVASAAGDARWPRWGPVGAMAGTLLGCAAWWSRRTMRSMAGAPDPPRGRLTVAAMAILAAVMFADVALPLPSGRLVDERGVAIWRVGDTIVAHLGANARSRSVLDAILRHRIDSLDLVVVTGGGLRTSGVVADLRAVAPVGTVLAADPSVVRDSTALEPGVVRVGDLSVRAQRAGGSWRVGVVATPRGAAAGRAARGPPLGSRP